ncbi:MAG: hypothetical protein KGK16_08520 [Bradyrhizobium sp.]|nr:hypothetical protein [Bradyrhizobium sp.]
MPETDLLITAARDHALYASGTFDQPAGDRRKVAGLPFHTSTRPTAHDLDAVSSLPDHVQPAQAMRAVRVHCGQPRRALAVPGRRRPSLMSKSMAKVDPQADQRPLPGHIALDQES